jgi:beta-glucosidase
MTFIEQLPEGFLFGAATSAYQIEGGWDADGKGQSIWDHFTRRPGRIFGGHNGQIACNTYEDFQTDVDIMRELGLDAYRFSIAWPRVLPEGRGQINEKGLDYYERLVDALLHASIAPFVTLFHWDLPLALHNDMGGFAHRDGAAIFADYVEVVARRLGDRVGHWITLNEPWVHATFGHIAGNHAPGRRNPWAYLRAVHHQLLGHGLAVERLRAIAPTAQVGISLNLTPFHPATDSATDRAAAALADQIINRLFLDPLFHGHYPEPLWGKLRFFHPPIRSGDMAIIGRPLDFLGVNYYTRARVRHSRLVPIFHLWSDGLPVMTGRRDGDKDAPYSQMGWEVYPAGLFELLFRLKQEYGNPPIYITENGAAFDDQVAGDGRVHDEQRRQYLEDHLAVTAAAARVGADVRGYFVWSLIDNFEWTYGYDRRFGIVHVDFASQRRTIKESGYWYKELIRRQKAGWLQAADPTPRRET